jgi:hypothetical protein
MCKSPVQFVLEDLKSGDHQMCLEVKLEKRVSIIRCVSQSRTLKQASIDVSRIVELLSRRTSDVCPKLLPSKCNLYVICLLSPPSGQLSHESIRSL